MGYQFPLLVGRILLLAHLLLAAAAADDDALLLGQSLNESQFLVSAGGAFRLGFFSTSSTTKYLGIWYNNIATRTVVWVANRQAPILAPAESVLALGKDGSLLLTDGGAGGSVHWSVNNSGGGGGSVARILDSGNFVLADSSGKYKWQSFDYPTDTLLPGMKLGRDLRSGLNRNLTGWKSSADPAPGDYTMYVDVTGVPQIFLTSPTDRLWRTGPWNGLRFTGIPEMKSYAMYRFDFAFVDDGSEVYYTYNVTNASSIVTRLIVAQTGQTQRLLWIESTGTWNTIWQAPKDPCDKVSPCGPYGYCDANTIPMCGCLQGFQPSSPQDWYLRDGKDGCARKTPLDCRNGTDGFLLVGGAKLPDTSKAVADPALSLDQCRALCFGNCSCTAYSAADISGGGRGTGCLLWTGDLTDLRVYANGGQDLYVRLAGADLGSSVSNRRRSSDRVVIVAVVFATLGAALSAWVGYLIMMRMRRNKRDNAVDSNVGGGGGTTERHHNAGSSRGGDLDLPLFDFDVIAAATDGFSDGNKLGEGGFGPVYKGVVGEQQQEVAIKRLAKNSVQGADEFRNEVQLIAKLQHRNLVRLAGCCIEGQERMLVYEFMPNGSLDAFLFDKERGVLLDWKIRYQIIAGIARGLLYLHQDSRFRIIHRDLKASNILLDEGMNPKISDFGMARIFGGDESEANNTKRVVGTYGYMSPEYAMDGIFSVKSDVFSFGVLVLEIVTGKKNRGFFTVQPQQNLLGHAWSLWKEDRGLELVDASIGAASSFPISQVLKCIRIGLLCVQERADDRPTMSSVVLMLGSDNALLPQPKQPGFVLARGPIEVYSSSGNKESCSVNDLTVTMFEGR